MQHEYALLGGVNRAKIGRYLTISAAAISAAIVFVILSIVDIAKSYNLPINLPPVVLSLVGAGSVFAALYWLFDKYGWKLPWIEKLLNVPNLAGAWSCDGQTINGDKTLGYGWKGQVTITQSWDKIRLHLETETSDSNSVAAALLYDEISGYRLLYHYQNKPKVTAVDLTPHRGFSELLFAKDCKTASGEYFNGDGRFTFGIMKLTRT